MAAGRGGGGGGVRRPRLRLKLHHWATGFIGLLCLAHLVISWQTIQQEEVWAGLSPAQKLWRSIQVGRRIPFASDAVTCSEIPLR